MSVQTWITIITAIISTRTAIFLAIITWRYVRLTNEILKATNTPVPFYLKCNEPFKTSQ